MFTRTGRRRWIPRIRANPSTSSTPRRRSQVSPVLGHLATALGISALATLALWFFLSQAWDWKPWALAWLAAINATAFTYYAFDKSRARWNRVRVPEAVLLTLAALGGSGGSYLGMHLFRHKNVNGRFRMVFWSIVLVQLGILAIVLRRMFFFGPGAILPN